MIIDAQEVPKKSKIRVVAQSRESQKLHFLTPVEIGGGAGRCLHTMEYWCIRPNLWHTLDERLLCRVAAWKCDKKYK